MSFIVARCALPVVSTSGGGPAAEPSTGSCLARIVTGILPVAQPGMVCRCWDDGHTTADDERAEQILARMTLEEKCAR
jgi:hypothetical protein